MTTDTTKKRKGFAVMDPALLRQISSLGGKTAQRDGRANRFTSETARAAGRKGGAATRAGRAAGEVDRG